jgi:hypothetical protein|tara:strand:+ start:479 stop:709 length:231 start_codon:yes stop_codon:yes gene_type:complete
MTRDTTAFNELAKVTKLKIGLDAFNDLARSHDAHVKEVERLQKELDKVKNVLEEVVVQLNNILYKNRNYPGIEQIT